LPSLKESLSCSKKQTVIDSAYKPGLFSTNQQQKRNGVEEMRFFQSNNSVLCCISQFHSIARDAAVSERHRGFNITDRKCVDTDDVFAAASPHPPVALGGHLGEQRGEESGASPTRETYREVVCDKKKTISPINTASTPFQALS